MNDKAVAWRHHLHANPELGNREFKTAAYIAEHLRALGFDSVAGVAHTGVVGVLREANPARRSHCAPIWMAYRSPKRPGCRCIQGHHPGVVETGVMHACGHDAHMAILMGAQRCCLDARTDPRHRENHFSTG